MIWLLICASVLTCAPLAAFVAHSRGGSGTAGFAVGAIFGPLGVLAAFAMGGRAELESRSIAAGEAKICPMCAESVRKAAVICRFCGHKFDAADTAPEGLGVASKSPEVTARGAEDDPRDLAIFVVLVIVGGGLVALTAYFG